MGGACYIDVKHEKCIENFKSHNLRGRDHLGGPGLDEKITLIQVFKN
jgi:hypothetical protein